MTSMATIEKMIEMTGDDHTGKKCSTATGISYVGES